MQLLLLSAFGYPFSALLVNILSSRGNSKAFLKLEILKKLVHSINFINAFYFGIESYLYGLIITTCIGVSLNILFAVKEIDLSALDFYKPIVTQILLCILSVYCTLLMHNSLETNYITGFFIKGCLFTFLFTGLNVVLKTKSFRVIHEQISLIIKSK
jgi:hypothetical protein